jgi:cell division protease FtsH
MSYQSISPLAYSEFQSLVRQGRVKEIVITADEIRGELKDPQPPNKRYFRTTRVENGLAEELQKYDVKFSGHIESRFFSTMLSWILPTLFFFGIWFLIMRRMSGQMGAGALWPPGGPHAQGHPAGGSAGNGKDPFCQGRCR